MNYLSPPEILHVVRDKGVEKANGKLVKLFVLAVLGGAYIAIGFLAYIRITAAMPHEWGSFATLLGACVFPIGLIAILLGGGELLTGNMMVLAAALAMKAIRWHRVVYNFSVVLIGNFVGAVIVAYFFGHIAGFTEGAHYLEKTLAVAQSKAGQNLLPMFVSAIGCNIVVSIGVWLFFAGKDVTGKIIACWFPIMTFALIGFQHVIANMFIIPAAIFSGESSIGWGLFFQNILVSFTGNLIGGAIFALMYCIAYRKQD